MHLIKVVMQQLLVMSFLIRSFKQWLFDVYHCFLVWVANQLAFSFQAAATWPRLKSFVKPSFKSVIRDNITIAELM